VRVRERANLWHKRLIDTFGARSWKSGLHKFANYSFPDICMGSMRERRRERKKSLLKRIQENYWAEFGKKWQLYKIKTIYGAEKHK
jgi:hypothetical protein